MHYDDFVDQVGRHAGLDATASERAIRATLEVLGELLPDERIDAIAAPLPPPCEKLLRTRTDVTTFDRETFYARVGEHEAVDVGFALEHTQVVCQELAWLLGNRLPALRAALPASVSDLFARRSHPRPPTAPAHPGRRRTLATGRPGSQHPVSEAAPRQAHQESIARTNNPHGDSKVSSGHVHLPDPVDEVPPGSEYPLSEGRE